MMKILFTIILNLFLSLCMNMFMNVFKPDLLLLMVWIMILSLYMKLIYHLHHLPIINRLTTLAFLEDLSHYFRSLAISLLPSVPGTLGTNISDLVKCVYVKQSVQPLNTARSFSSL